MNAASKEILKTAAGRQAPGFYRKRIGDVVVTALSDGYLDADVGVLRRIERAEIDRILHETFRPGSR